MSKSFGELKSLESLYEQS